MKTRYRLIRRGNRGDVFYCVDTKTGKRIAIACTSNCKLRDFEERFQTRFLVFEIAPPSTEEIITLLHRYLPNEPEVVNAANFADGNGRQALLDAKRLVQRSLQLVAA
jgi:hypothetical protein